MAGSKVGPSARLTARLTSIVEQSAVNPVQLMFTTVPGVRLKPARLPAVVPPTVNATPVRNPPPQPAGSTPAGYVA